MRKFFLIAIVSFLFSFSSKGLHVTIIEAQASSAGQVMDTMWRHVAIQMGHTATIEPQSILSSTTFFSTTDVLIVSSAVDPIFSNEIQTIQQFLQTGKPVYIQSEYLASYDGNIAFAQCVNNLGGTFSWINTVQGMLTPMNVLGAFATTNNNIPPLSYFWYGVRGTGDCHLVPFLEFAGNNVGFQYIFPNGSIGNIVTTSDQDWVHTQTSLPLMENIITQMINPTTNSIAHVNLGPNLEICNQGLQIDLVYPNATYLWSNGSTSSSFIISSPGTYWVTVNINGCVSFDTIVNTCPTDTTPVFPEPVILLQMPNVFSPNNDGSNEIFMPIEFEGIETAHIHIYNRWGNEVFSSNDILKGWNGKYNGDYCADGVYYWVVNYTDLKERTNTVKGTVTLKL